MTFGSNLKTESLNIFFTGLILLAVFTWKDIISDIIERNYPLQRDTVRAQLIFAIVVTIVTVLVVTYVKPRLE